MTNRTSDDRDLGTTAAVVELAEIAFRPDLQVRWDDETVATAAATCARVPSRRARRTTFPQPLTPTDAPQR